MAFENIDYAISRKLVVRFQNFFINVRKLIFIKKFSAE